MGDRDVEMQTVALGTGRIHLLEPDGRALAERVDQRPVGRGAGLVDVGQHGAPERAYSGDVESIDGYLEQLNRTWGRAGLGLDAGRTDSAGDAGVAIGHRP